eukprot:Skav223875  [mRNA]  locus=scaffold1226:340495:341082:+ [translate_table: standard]
MSAEYGMAEKARLANGPACDDRRAWCAGGKVLSNSWRDCWCNTVVAWCCQPRPVAGSRSWSGGIGGGCWPSASCVQSGGVHPAFWSACAAAVAAWMDWVAPSGCIRVDTSPCVCRGKCFSRTGNEPAQETQYAAMAVVLAEDNPNPPCDSGRCATARLLGGKVSIWRSCCKQAATAISWSKANWVVAVGGHILSR